MSSDSSKTQPILFVFAGPNGSGKTTVKRSLSGLPKLYINADDIQVKYHLSVLEAAKEADRQRNEALQNMESFAFETVLSTDRNLLLMQRAKELGYMIDCIYVLTCNPTINISRVKVRTLNGGHDVPIDKIKTRYEKALKLLPQVVSVCDQMLIFDNSNDSPVPIFIKENNTMKVFPSLDWDQNSINNLLFPK